MEALRVFHEENRRAVEAAALAAEDVAAAAEWAAASLRAGGRLAYAGAGTSGRLGVLDASECPPTFGVPAETVVALIAGGDAALRHAVEGAEDSDEGGAQAVRDIRLGPLDTFIGVSASGTAPYALGALKEAKRLGSKTALLCCVPHNHQLDGFVDRQICAVVGPRDHRRLNAPQSGNGDQTDLEPDLHARHDPDRQGVRQLDGECSTRQPKTSAARPSPRHDDWGSG